MNKKGLRQHNKAFYYTVETNYLQAYKTVSKTSCPGIWNLKKLKSLAEQYYLEKEVELLKSRVAKLEKENK